MCKLSVTVLLLSMLCAGPVAAGPGEDADAAYARGDHAAALKIYQGLAAQGLAPVQFNLGVMHDFGQGVAKDPVEAVRWYRAAAVQVTWLGLQRPSREVSREVSRPMVSSNVVQWLTGSPPECMVKTLPG